MNVPYRHLDHTSDLRVEVYGETLEKLFANSAFAMFDTIAELRHIPPRNQRTIHVDGIDLADLMFNWLRELLSIWTVDKCLVSGTENIKIKENSLLARAVCTPPLTDRSCLKHEIKAVTYHGLEVARTDGLWTARVIFDV